MTLKDMKTFCLLMMCIMMTSFAATTNCQIFSRYKHKSEIEIQQMTPSQRVDEWINEYFHHQSSAHNFDPDDKQYDLIQKYIYIDKFKAIPRIVEIINSYEPKRDINNRKKSHQFEQAVDLLRFIDCFKVRIRSSEEGSLAINGLEQAVKRMRAAGFVTSKEKPPEEESGDRHSMIEVSEIQLEELKGVNDKDRRIQNTLRVTYKTKLNDTETLAFSNFLTANHPDYPSWTDSEPYMDTLPNGHLLRIFIMKEPQRYYAAFGEFTKAKGDGQAKQ